jgi:uncharacterized membrane protein YpjA
VNLAILGVASRVFVFTSAIIGTAIFGVKESTASEQFWDLGLPFVNLFSRWDAGWYMTIAQNGYPPGNNPIDPSWAWFPLYPTIMRVTAYPLLTILPPAQAVALAGFVVSNVLFFVTLLIFFKLSETVLGSQQLAFVSALFFAFWPGSLFYSCVYSESLFMTLTLGSFYLLEREKMWPATFLGFLAGLTRANGFLVAIPFLVRSIEKRSFTSVFKSFLIGSSYLVFSLFGYAMTGVFPVREIVFRQYWGTTPPLFVQLFQLDIGYGSLYTLELLFVLLPFVYFFVSKPLLATQTWGFRNAQREAKYYTFSFVQLGIILFYTMVNNLHRYAVLMIPMYWILAMVKTRNQAIGTALLALLTTLLLIGTVLFATWRNFL